MPNWVHAVSAKNYTGIYGGHMHTYNDENADNNPF